MTARCLTPCVPICASFASSIFRCGGHIVDQASGAEMNCAHHEGRPLDRAEERRKRLWIADRDIVHAESLRLELETSGPGDGVTSLAIRQARGCLAQNLVEDGSRLSLCGREVTIARGQGQTIGLTDDRGRDDANLNVKIAHQ